MDSLSQRVQRIKPSPTLAITARAKALKDAGENIIGLGAGEPDFDTPEHIKKAAIKAIEQGLTKYTAVVLSTVAIMLSCAALVAC